MTVRNGLDRLIEDFPEKFKGFRIGLVANTASVSAKGCLGWDALLDEGFELSCIFAPEHGLRLEYQEGVFFDSSRDESSGLEIRSLYDSTKSIDSSKFTDVDLIVYDLPNVGCRFYTYVNTLVELLQYCHRSSMPIVVLDRPNIIRADIVEGPIADESIVSPFGPDQVPVRYGMTLGEFARFHVTRHRLSSRLTVVLMDGYEREMWFDETDLPFVATSPNLCSPQAMLLYPGTCLFEGTELSEGRGSDHPFEIFGAPWLDVEALLSVLEPSDFPGMTLSRQDFVPTRSKHAGVSCRGIRLQVQERDLLRPFSAVLRILFYVRRLHGDADLWIRKKEKGQFFIDLLLCDDYFRRAIDEGKQPERMLQAYEGATEQFARARLEHLAYGRKTRRSVSFGKVRSWKQ